MTYSPNTEIYILLRDTNKYGLYKKNKTKQKQINDCPIKCVAFNGKFGGRDYF